MLAAQLSRHGADRGDPSASLRRLPRRPDVAPGLPPEPPALARGHHPVPGDHHRLSQLRPRPLRPPHLRGAARHARSVEPAHRLQRRRADPLGEPGALLGDLRRAGLPAGRIPPRVRPRGGHPPRHRQRQGSPSALDRGEPRRPERRARRRALARRPRGTAPGRLRPQPPRSGAGHRRSRAPPALSARPRGGDLARGAERGAGVLRPARRDGRDLRCAPRRRARPLSPHRRPRLRAEPGAVRDGPVQGPRHPAREEPLSPGHRAIGGAVSPCPSAGVRGGVLGAGGGRGAARARRRGRPAPWLLRGCGRVRRVAGGRRPGARRRPLRRRPARAGIHAQDVERQAPAPGVPGGARERQAPGDPPRRAGDRPRADRRRKRARARRRGERRPGRRGDRGHPGALGAALQRRARRRAALPAPRRGAGAGPARRARARCAAGAGGPGALHGRQAPRHRAARRGRPHARHLRRHAQRPRARARPAPRAARAPRGAGAGPRFGAGHRRVRVLGAAGGVERAGDHLHGPPDGAGALGAPRAQDVDWLGGVGREPQRVRAIAGGRRAPAGRSMRSSCPRGLRGSASAAS